MRHRKLFAASLALVTAIGLGGCSSGWSDADLASVESYCATAADWHADSCASWIDGIYRLSNCDPEQAKRVIDRIIAEYNGAPALSIAENYELVGCSYGAR
jgi:hypothetical protein